MRIEITQYMIIMRSGATVYAEFYSRNAHSKSSV